MVDLSYSSWMHKEKAHLLLFREYEIKDEDIVSGVDI
jgi:hypothetical protein